MVILDPLGTRVNFPSFTHEGARGLSIGEISGCTLLSNSPIGWEGSGGIFSLGGKIVWISCTNFLMVILKPPSDRFRERRLGVI